jgi:hypothetical protein
VSTVQVTEASKAGAPTGARTEITLVTPGWGSSGYYSPEVLEQAAADLVFPAGTQMHIDHDKGGGVGSVSTLAAALEVDARWEPDWVDPDTGVKGRLVAENKVFSHKREMLKELKDVIGTSIAAAAEISMGEAEGRQGAIIERLLPAKTNRVDYVTVAGRGGRISEVLESGQGIVDRAVEAGVTEATAGETRDWLRAAVRAAHEGSGTYAWLIDYDDTSAYYEVETPTGTAIYQDTYTVEGVVAALGGTPVEVRPVTTYQPVGNSTAEAATTSSPSAPAGVIEGKEPPVATIQIEESVHADLVEKSSRATALEADVTAANTRATTAEAALKESNDSAAAALVNAALEAAGITAPKTAARLAEGYPVKENGAVDAVALAESVAESIAELQAASGAGSVRGVGHTAEDAAAPTAQSAREEILKLSGYTPKGA